jgi:hypothetical protein
MKYFNNRKNNCFRWYLLAVAAGSLLFLNSCFHYGFTGASIPAGIKSIYIPFFPNNSSSSISNISNKLNEALIDRFIKKSPLHLAKHRNGADAILEGSIYGFSDKPFSISGNTQATQNRVQIEVKAKFKFADKKKFKWNKTFSGSATYDPNKNPIQGENDAAMKALDQIANNMFNEAVSGW